MTKMQRGLLTHAPLRSHAVFAASVFNLGEAAKLHNIGMKTLTELERIARACGYAIARNPIPPVLEPRCPVTAPFTITVYPSIAAWRGRGWDR